NAVFHLRTGLWPRRYPAVRVATRLAPPRHSEAATPTQALLCLALRYGNSLSARWCSRALRKSQSQHAFLELGFRFRFVHLRRQFNGTLKRAIAALHSILPFLLFFALVFLFAFYGKYAILDAHINVFGF